MAEKKRKHYFCDEDCNNCPVILHHNSRQLTVVLNALQNLYGDTVYRTVQHYCPNMTVCFDCRIDDFCHCEECELADEAEKYAEENDGRT